MQKDHRPRWPRRPGWGGGAAARGRRSHCSHQTLMPKCPGFRALQAQDQAARRGSTWTPPGVPGAPTCCLPASPWRELSPPWTPLRSLLTCLWGGSGWTAGRAGREGVQKGPGGGQTAPPGHCHPPSALEEPRGPPRPGEMRPCTSPTEVSTETPLYGDRVLLGSEHSKGGAHPPCQEGPKRLHEKKHLHTRVSPHWGHDRRTPRSADPVPKGRHNPRNGWDGPGAAALPPPPLNAPCIAAVLSDPGSRALWRQLRVSNSGVNSHSQDGRRRARGPRAPASESRF